MANEDRFRDLFRSNYSWLHRYARNRGLIGTDADDLVAATFEIAWRRIEDVPLDDPAPWLFAVARNLWRNKCRSDQRARSLLERLDAGIVHVDPDESEAHPTATAIRAALGRLGDDDRELLILIAWDGLTPTQAAAVLGCSPVAARTRLHRARRRLAGLLDPRRPLQRNVFSGHVGVVPTILTTEASDG
jgi:RNA polymerase sigma factor (sigma-70 family)